MFFEKLFLKRETKGVSLIELIIALAILGILAIWMLSAFRPKQQVGKANDGKRKTDLQRIQTVLEDYYNDHNCYPTDLYPTDTCNESFSPYLARVPCDPEGNFYEYVAPAGCPQYYRIYTKLKNIYDPDIEKVGCEEGCGPARAYNYGVGSSNVGLEVGEVPTSTPIPQPTSTPTPTPTPTFPPGIYYGCRSGVCISLPGPICEPNYLSSDCYSACSNPLNECK